MDPNVKNAERRAYRYWYEDGFIDILLGAFFLLVGTTSLLQDVAVPEGFATAAGVARIIVVVAAAVSLSHIVRKLKQQVTYARTGYVGYRRRPAWVRWVKIGTGLAAGVAIGLLATSQRDAVRWLPLLGGILVGGALLYAGIRFDLARYCFLALVAVLAGGALAWLDLAESLRLAVLLGVVGLGQIIAGVVTLIRYLRRHPRQENGV
jgi:hypothetical protein